MKKLLFFFICNLVLSIYSYSQSSIKISEISPQSNAIELYSPSPSSLNLDCYTVISFVKEKRKGVDVLGYYIINFPNSTFSQIQGVGAANSNYLFCSGNSSSGEFNWATSIGQAIFQPLSTDAAGNYVLNGSSRQVASNEKILSDKPVVFLLNGTSVVDVFVSGIGTQLSTVQSEILKFPSFNLSPCSSLINIALASTTISSFQADLSNNAAGSGKSYTWISTVSNGVCQSSWTAQNNESLNSGSISNIATWDDKYFQKIGQTWTAITNSTNTFSSTSTSFERDNAGNIINVRFRLEIIDPYAFTVDATTPIIKIFKDNGGQQKNNSVFESDTEITPVSKTFLASPANTFEVVVNYSDLFDNSTTANSNTLFNIFVQIQVSTSPCFNTVTLLRFPEVAALPVNLSSYSVKSVDKDVKLSWSTSSEQNNKGFEIQRSIGNTNDFKTIGFVGTRAKDGNSQTEIAYSFEDADVKAGQTHYYRLNQIDFDGKATLSPVRSVKPGSIESNLNVYPNPSQGSVTVNTGSASGKLNIYVLDNSGRVVNQYINVSTSNTRINNLKKGFYTLKLVNTETGEQSAQRVVVQ